MKLRNNAQFINYYESKNFTKSYQLRTDNLDFLFRFIFIDFRGYVKIHRIMIKNRYLIGPTTRFLLTAEQRAHEKNI